MTTSLSLLAASVVLVGVGAYLMLERSLTRVLIGLVILSNGVNLGFLVASGEPGAPPLLNEYDAFDIADPLPQALVLTAIVITLGTVSFVLAMAYRSWQLAGNDDVQDDVEDAAIRRLAAADEASDAFDLTVTASPDDSDDEVTEEEGASSRPVRDLEESPPTWEEPEDPGATPHEPSPLPGVRRETPVIDEQEDRP